MKYRLPLKITAAVTAAMTAAVCTVYSAGADVEKKGKVTANRYGELSSTYTEYLSGDVSFDEDSGIKPAPYTPSAAPITPEDELPHAYKTKTTEIRNQGGYNTCWAFSGVGTLEAFLSHEGRGFYDFSEQHLAWWATADYNSSGIGWQTPSLAYGGYSMISAGYFTSWEGPKLERDIPYLTTGNSRPPENMESGSIPFGTTGIMYVNNDIVSVKTAVYKYGGVATSFNNGSGYNSDKSNYYQSDQTSRYSGHAITIIGWDDDYSRYNFDEDDRPGRDGAWLAKNSWGTGKGDDGYLWISYYDKYVLDDNIWGVNLAFTSVRTANQYDRLYQNEKYGATFYTYVSNESGVLSKATFANVFDFDSEHKYLNEVVFETQAAGAEYHIYYIPVESGEPVGDRNKWTRIAGGTIDYSGYVCAKIAKPFEVSGTAAVGVEIIDKNGGMAMLGVDEWLVNNDGKYVFMPSQNRGESFVIDGSNVYDLVDIYALNDDDIGGTLVIKAVASSAIVGDANGDLIVNSDDALIVLRESVGINTLDDERRQQCDVVRDGKLTAEDALKILRSSVGLVNEF